MTKTMNKNNTFLFLLLLTTNLFAQNQLPQDILISVQDTTGGVATRRMAKTGDGGFLITGSSGLNGFITRINGCGQVMWTHQYLFGDETELNSVTELPSGEIIAVGACRNCVPADSVLKALVIKTDQAGALQSDTTFGYANFNARAYDVIATSSGKVALTGHVDFAGFLGPSDAFLAVLDQDFHLEIWKQYNHFYRDIGDALTHSFDGGFVIAGRSVPAFLAPAQAQLFRTNADGTQLWKYTSPYQNSEFNDVQEAADGRIVALGDRTVDTLIGRDLYLSVHNGASGSLALEKTYGSTADDEGNSLELLQNGGYLVGAIYGAPSSQYWNRRDWIFRLNGQFELQDQYFRDNYLFAHDLINAVPLSPDGKSFAFYSHVWFFSDHYQVFFKRTFNGNLASLSQAPLHYQLVPRNPATNKGTVIYQGAVSDPNAYDEIRLDVFRNDVLQSTFSDNTPQSFEFLPQITAELANYTFRLCGVKNQTQYEEAEACEVVAGDAYIIQGQSNAVAGLPVFDPDADHAYNHYTTPFVRNFGLKYAGNDSVWTWHKDLSLSDDYADQISGQWGLVLGKNIADTYGIPVAIFNGGISGISIDSMMPDPLDHANTATRYGRFLRRIEQSGLKNYLRAKLMFQGETNAAGGLWDSADEYYQKFVTLDNAWKQDFPSAQNGYLFQIRPGAYFAGATLLTCLQIEEAQRRIAETVPGWQIMSSTGMNHDGTHYYYENGYERAGNDMFRLIAQDLYGAAPAGNIHPPTVESLKFSHCNRQEISLQLRHTNDSYAWTPGWESDFLIEGSTAVTVTSGQVSGNTVILALSAAPGPGFTGLSYTSHPGGDAAPVKNANGIGMLTFLNLQVDEYDLAANATSTAVSCYAGSDGTAMINVEGGTPGYSYLWSNGATAQTAGNLSAGAYSATATDAKGCTASAQTTIGQPAAPLSLADTLITADNGAMNGSISLTPAGGTPPYTYHWSIGGTAPNVEGLVWGSYTVTVTDAQQCSQVFELVVPFVVGTSVATGEPAMELFPNPCTAFLYVRFPEINVTGQDRIEVTDMLGRQLPVQVDAQQQLIQVETGILAPGAYLITVSGEGGWCSSAVFVKN